MIVIALITILRTNTWGSQFVVVVFAFDIPSC